MSKSYKNDNSDSESADLEEVPSDESGEEDDLESEDSASAMSDASGFDSDISDNKRPGERNSGVSAVRNSGVESDSASVVSAVSVGSHNVLNGKNRSPADDSDSDSDSLRSIETAEAVKEESNTSETYSSSYGVLDNGIKPNYFVPAGGVFEHALLRGVPVTIADDYGEDNDQAFNSPARTTTRTTPANVMDAIDRELRFAKPPVTVEHLVSKYNVIKLVIKRRVDHLKSLGHTTAGITMYDVSGYDGADGAAQDDSAENSVAGDVDALQDPDTRRRLYFDIQFLSPPITVRELAQKYRIHPPTLQAKISYLRNKGISTRGVDVYTGNVQSGRGRPRKMDPPEQSTPRSPAPRDAGTKERVTGYKRPPLHFFTREEDAIITAEVLRCNAANTSVHWYALDDSFGRNKGASKQRWQKTLSLKADAGAAPAQRSDADDRAYLLRTYNELTAASAAKQEPTTAVDVARNNLDNGNIDSAPVPSEEEATPAAEAEAEAALRREVQNSVRCMLVSIERLAHIKEQQAALRNAAQQQPNSSSARPSASTTASSTVARKNNNYTAEDDAFIVRSVLDFQARGFKVVWSHLDKQMGRLIGSARARWLRALQQQTASYTGDSNNIGSNGGSAGDSASRSSSSSAVVKAEGGNATSLWNKYTAYVAHRRHVSAILDGAQISKSATSTGSIASTAGSTVSAASSEDASEERTVSRTVLRDLISVLVHDHNDALDRSRAAPVRIAKAPRIRTPVNPERRPFTPQEDAHIAQQALKWLTTQCSPQWQTLDARLSRSKEDSCYFRWLNVLCNKLPRTVQMSAQRARLLTVYAVKCDDAILPPSEAVGMTPCEDKVIVSAVLAGMLRAVEAVSALHTNVQAVYITNEQGNDQSFDQQNGAASSSGSGGSAQPPHLNRAVNPGVGRTVKRFTAEEDAIIVARVTGYQNAGQSVKWGALDKELGRSTGAAKQRWQRVLSPPELSAHS